MEKIKQIIQKAGPVRMGAALLCGILLLAFAWGDSLYGGGEEEAEAGSTDAPAQTEETALEQYKETMERELVELLRRVEGVGDVEVMLTLRASNEKVTLKDNNSRNGSNEEETVLVEDSERNSSPYVIQEREPELEGVVIVCDGGDDAGIKREITEAVGALFQIESHKIKIMKGKEAKE